MKILLECPVFNVEAALKAATYGADRLELCSSFAEGGETPGAGMLRYLKGRIGIPVFVMIRPRGGDFVYSDDEIDVMAEEIRLFKSLGADGFVFGILNEQGNVNRIACKKLVGSAEGLPCTFHRAFDVCSDPEEALEEIISCGFKRVLTSGGKSSVKEGLPVIKKLLVQAGERITIMPGGGMEPELIPPLRETDRLREIHASCKERRPVKGRSLAQLSSGKELPPAAGVWTISREKAEAFRKRL